VYRLLSRYETEQQIEQQHCSRNSIITITNYDQYQKVNSGLNKDRTASEQPVNTNKQLTNLINEKNNTVLEEIQEILTYLNEATGRDFNLITVTNQYEIKKRLAEGFKVEDFKTVVDNMVSVWAGKPEKTQYFRPQTLFGENFDAYRQAKKVVKKRLAPNQMM